MPPETLIPLLIGLATGLLLGAATTAGWLRSRAALLTERLTTREQQLQTALDRQQTLSDQWNDEQLRRVAAEERNTRLPLLEATLEQQRQRFESVFIPLRESVHQVDQRLSRWETERTSQHAGLSEQLRALAIAQQKLHGETAGLVQALRAPQVRGRWGEIQLQRVVELAGMLEHCDFYQQPSASTDDGRLRPDLIVRLPGDRQVVIDAKCALDAYLDAQQADTDLLRREKLTAHARQVRQHIQRLSAKAYWDQFQPAPEFVVLFLPGESFFSAALEQDPSLIEAGADRKVLLATPTTLIALLRAVAYGWRQEQTARHAQAIADLGRELHDRIRILTDHLAAMGTGLQTAVTAYNQAVASLETRLLVSARRFRDLGVAADRDIPVLNPLETQPRSLDSTPPTPPPPSQP